MPPTGNRWAAAGLLALLVGCDHATKIAAKAGLEGEPPQELLRGVLGLRYAENRDVGFNLLRAVPEGIRAPLLLVAGAVAMAVLAMLLFRRRGLAATSIALLLITAGAAGNYLDRVFRGYVIDFVQLPHWPVFNVADIYVTAGALLLVARTLSVRKAATGPQP